MELVAQQVMDGYVQGMHRSPHIGFALDFAQHRQYVPGDDVKRIDWRAFAKSERYYIKQYEVSTNLRATSCWMPAGRWPIRAQRRDEQVPLWRSTSPHASATSSCTSRIRPG